MARAAARAFCSLAPASEDPYFRLLFQGFEGVLEVISNGPQISLVALRYDNPDSSVFATTPVMAATVQDV